MDEEIKDEKSKTKVMVVSKNGGSDVNVHLNEERMKQVECFRCLSQDRRSEKRRSFESYMNE